MVLRFRSLGSNLGFRVLSKGGLIQGFGLTTGFAVGKVEFRVEFRV